MTEPRYYSSVSDPDSTTRIPADAPADVAEDYADLDESDRAGTSRFRSDPRPGPRTESRPDSPLDGRVEPRGEPRPGGSAGSAGSAGAGPGGGWPRQDGDRRESSFAAQHLEPGYAGAGRSGDGPNGQPRHGYAGPAGSSAGAGAGNGPAGRPGSSGGSAAPAGPGSHPSPAGPAGSGTQSGLSPDTSRASSADDLFGGSFPVPTEESLGSRGPGGFDYGASAAEPGSAAAPYAGTAYPSGVGYPTGTGPGSYGSGSGSGGSRDADSATAALAGFGTGSGFGVGAGLGVGAGVGTAPFVGGSTLGTSPSRAGSRAGRGSAVGRPVRRARLLVRHIDPWSTFKFSLVLAVALFFVWLVAVGVLYGVLDGIGVFDKINNLYDELTGNTGDRIITPGLVLGMATLIGAVNIVLMTALATVGSFVYNICSDLVGGIEVTLAERE